MLGGWDKGEGNFFSKCKINEHALDTKPFAFLAFFFSCPISPHHLSPLVAVPKLEPERREDRVMWSLSVPHVKVHLWCVETSYLVFQHLRLASGWQTGIMTLGASAVRYERYKHEGTELSEAWVTWAKSWQLGLWRETLAIISLSLSLS